MTKERIAALRANPSKFDHDYTRETVDECCDLMLLGLAVRESGVDASDIAIVVGGVGSAGERMKSTVVVAGFGRLLWETP